MAVDEAAKQETERQWRIARGNATAEDRAGPITAAGPLTRGSWMTELPAERRPRATPTQVFETFYFI